jgi:F-type H+-transporting ATPase subunit b
VADLLNKEMLGDLIINLINIVILFFAAKGLLYKPVKRFLDARREAAANAEAETQRQQDELRRSKEKYDSLMSDTAAIRLGAQREAEEKARAAAEEILAEARAEAGRITEESRAAAEKERRKMLSDAQEQIGALAVEIAGKILERETSDADDRRIIEKFFAEQG